MTAFEKTISLFSQIKAGGRVSLTIYKTLLEELHAEHAALLERLRELETPAVEKKPSAKASA